MTQKIDPFIKLNWGWDTGEGGWGEGMNENLIIHAFLQSKRIDNILASASLLPVTPVNGDAYFAEDDETLYIRAEGSWYTLQPTVGMLFILKTTEAVVKYNGTTLVSDTKTISEVVGLQGALDDKVSSVLVGASSGVAPLGVDGKVPAGYLPASGSYLGTWDASINSPTITSGVGNSGEFYKVSVGGSVVIDGTGSWTTGDEIRFNGTIWQRIPNTNLVASVNGYTGTVVLSATDVGAAATSHTHSNATTTVNGFMSSTDKVKLNGVAIGATANSPDATLLNRANHTGTQSQSTITNLTTDLSAKQELLVNTVNIKSVNGTSLLGSGNIVVSSGGSTTFTGLTDTPATYTGQALKFTRINSGETALEFVSLGSAAYNNSGDFANSSHTHANATTVVSGFMSNGDKVKLDTIATGATANSSDATLLARANHTGTQTSSTISDFNSAVDARVVSGIVGKENTIVAGTTAQYWRGDKSWQALDKAAIGLSNVDNTSDASKNAATVTLTNKTISGLNNTLTNIPQSSVSGLVTDLGLKAPSTSPTFTGSVVLPAITSIGSVGGTEISYLSGVTSGIQAQLNSKQALDADLTAIAALSGAGFAKRTGADTWTLDTSTYLTGINSGNVTTALGYTPINKAGDSGVGSLSLTGSLTAPFIKGDGSGVEGYVNNATPTGYSGGSLIATNSAGNIPTISFHSYGVWGGSIQMTSGSNFSFKGSDGITAAGITAGGATFTGKPVIRFNAGANPTYSSGHLELSNAGSGNPVVLGFHREGYSETSLVHKADSDGLHVMRGGALDGILAGMRASEFRLGSGSAAVSHNGNSQVALKSNNPFGLDLALYSSGGTLQGGITAGFDAVGKIGFVNGGTYRLWINPDGSSQSSGNFEAPSITTGTISPALCTGSGNLDKGLRWHAPANYNYGVGVSSAEGGVEYHSHHITAGLANSHRWYSGDMTSTTNIMTLYSTGVLAATSFVGSGTSLTGVVLSSIVGAVNGVAPLGADSKVPAAYLPASGSYSGSWNASTNSPTITSGSGSNGQFYIVGVAGSTNIDGVTSWGVGDQLRFNGSVWQRIPNTNAVTSVAGKVGVVTLDKNDVGLTNIDNTSDANKPVSTATQTALNSKQNLLGYTPANKAGDTFTGDVNVGTINVDEMNVFGHNIKSTGSGFLDITSTDDAYSGINLFNSLDVYRGAVYADNSGVHIATSTGRSLTIANNGDATFTDDVKIDGALVVDGSSTFTNNVNCGWTFDCNGPATFTDDVNITGSLTADGSGLSSLNASNLTIGTVSDSRLPSIQSAKQFSAVSSDTGFKTTTFSSNVRNPIWRFGNADGYGISYFHGTSGYGSSDSVGVHFGTATNGGSILRITPVLIDVQGSGVFSGGVTVGGSLTVGGVSVALVSNTVSKATPSQLFQNIGTVSGAVSVNGSNGLHILATVNGNTTWTLPTPSATEALALTLELTNGGAYTMTWPTSTRWAGGVAPTLTTSGTDVLVFTKAGTNNWRGYLSSKDSK